MRAGVPVMVNDGGTDVAEVGLGVRGEATGPGDVAVGVWVQGVLAFGENPAGAGVVFAECEVVGGDVAVFRGGGKALFACGELVHEFEGDIGFLGAEVRGAEAAGELLRRFPADLAAEAGLVTAAVTGAKTAHESEKDCFNEVPIFGATGY